MVFKLDIVKKEIGDSCKYKVEIDKHRCKGCRLCVFFCPVKHLELSEDLNNRGIRFAVVKEETKCIGCGFCFVICPDVCIKIKKTDD